MKGINEMFVSIFSVFFKLPLVIYVDFIKGVYEKFFTLFNGFFFNFLEIAWNQKNKIKYCKVLNPNKKQFWNVLLKVFNPKHA